MLAIGLMSGTSMDGIDAAAIETDGETLHGIVARGSRPYRPAERALLRAAMADAEGLADRDARPGALAAAETMLTASHADAVESLIADAGLARENVAVVGFHGQTVLHKPEAALTIQLGDGAALSRRLGLDVVHDFRAADMAQGGQGAPLVPVYHAALALHAGLVAPLAFVNIGGVANLTFLGATGDLIAFDTGPGNGPLDDLSSARGGAPFDADGRLALSGHADQAIIAAALTDPFYAARPPKSLDRRALAANVARLPLADAMATLAGITAAGIVVAFAHLPAVPSLTIIAGGGAHNAALVGALRRLLPGRIEVADALGLAGGHIEAEAFAFLAVRSLAGLPLTFPGTTGVAAPTTGGVLARGLAAA